MADKVQKIREEVQKIARSINPYIPDEEGKNSEYEAGRFAMVTQIMQIIDSMQEEPVSEDLEEAVNAYIGYAPEVDESSSTYGKRQAFKAGANWQKQQMMAKAVDVTIAIPYQNGYGGYTQLVDSKEGLPFGENLKVLVIKE